MRNFAAILIFLAGWVSGQNSEVTPIVMWHGMGNKIVPDTSKLSFFDLPELFKANFTLILEQF
jgi:hypothetical protein